MYDSHDSQINNKDNPLISIVIPAYNTVQYLPACLDSVRNQTYGNLEILLVNDGSTDGTGMVCETYAKKDSRISVIQCAVHSGPSFSRNLAISQACGELIGFADSDDLLEPDMIASLFSCLKSRNADAVICDYREEYPDGEADSRIVTEDFPDGSGRDTAKRILRFELTDYSWNKLFRADCVKPVRYPEGMYYEDIATVFRFVDNCRFVSHLGRPLYHYIRRSGSITRVHSVDREADYNTACLMKLCYCRDHIPELVPELACKLFTSMLTFDILLSNEGLSAVIYKEDPRLSRIRQALKEFRSVILDNYKGRMKKLKSHALLSDRNLPHRILYLLYRTDSFRKKLRLKKKDIRF